MNPMIKGLLKNIPVIAKAIGITKDNINPAKTPSSGVAYAGVAAITALQNYPQTEYDVLMQIALGLISAWCFYTKKN